MSTTKLAAEAQSRPDASALIIIRGSPLLAADGNIDLLDIIGIRNNLHLARTERDTGIRV